MPSSAGRCRPTAASQPSCDRGGSPLVPRGPHGQGRRHRAQAGAHLLLPVRLRGAPQPDRADAHGARDHVVAREPPVRRRVLRQPAGRLVQRLPPPGRPQRPPRGAAPRRLPLRVRPGRVRLRAERAGHPAPRALHARCSASPTTDAGTRSTSAIPTCSGCMPGTRSSTPGTTTSRPTTPGRTARRTTPPTRAAGLPGGPPATSRSTSGCPSG